MLSQQHKLAAADPAPGQGPRAANAIAEDRILDAAYQELLAIGMRRLTMADVARRAGVSRATLYRRWPNVQSVVASLVTREFASVTESVRAASAAGRPRLVAAVVAAVAQLRAHPLLRKIIEVDAEFLVPYLVHRSGSSARAQQALLEAGIRAGQADGSIRAGDAASMATAVLLAAWSFTLTGPVLATGARLGRLDKELGELIDRYLTP